MIKLGHHALAQLHYRSAARQFRQWSAQLAADHRCLQVKRTTEVPF